MGLQKFLAATLFFTVGAGTAQSAQPAPDFAFRLKFERCTANTLDTYESRFTRGMGPDPAISIPLKLSQEQMVTVFEAIVSIRLFEYPTKFAGVVSGLGKTSITSPSTSYRFQVRNAGLAHTVSWDDGYGPRSEAANRLLNLLKMIIGFINDHPDVKRLPMPRVGCE